MESKKLGGLCATSAWPSIQSQACGIIASHANHFITKVLTVININFLVCTYYSSIYSPSCQPSGAGPASKRGREGNTIKIMLPGEISTNNKIKEQLVKGHTSWQSLRSSLPMTLTDCGPTMKPICFMGRKKDQMVYL